MRGIDGRLNSWHPLNNNTASTTGNSVNIRMNMRFVAAGVLALLAASAAPARAQTGTADFMAPISGTPAAPSAAATAAGNVLALNSEMFGLYDTSGRIFQANILAKHPVILALFSGAGGRLILYRPGQPPLDAPSVPQVYQLLKSVGHATMVLPVLIGPYLDAPGSTAWVGPLRAYRSRMQSALDTLDAAEMPAEWRPVVKTILVANIGFMDDCLKANAVGFAGSQAFAKAQAPHLKKIITWAAQTQVAHWMNVMAGWKTMLGADFDKTYAASNSIYVARQNNILFSVLAQFFGQAAINDRLMLLETTNFTTTPADMLELVTRIVADRSVGALFFGSYHLMDYELMGGDGRTAIIAETTKRGMATVLPPVVPFGSTQFPNLITPGPGAASLADLN